MVQFSKKMVNCYSFWSEIWDHYLDDFWRCWTPLWDRSSWSSGCYRHQNHSDFNHDAPPPKFPPCLVRIIVCGIGNWWKTIKGKASPRMRAKQFDSMESILNVREHAPPGILVDQQMVGLLAGNLLAKAIQTMSTKMCLRHLNWTIWLRPFCEGNEECLIPGIHRTSPDELMLLPTLPDSFCLSSNMAEGEILRCCFFEKCFPCLGNKCHFCTRGARQND